MKTTYFRPSIHGWPFDNSWTVSIGFMGISIPMGFCGGMCWRALHRFYDAIPIPRNTADPSQGDALYEEILNAQVSSLPPLKIAMIYDWQQSPDLSSDWNWHHSLGHRTQQQWPSVKRSLDENKPVTITLVADSNNYNPMKLKESHRAIAYAYDVAATSQGDGSPRGADYKVTIWIYDPNFGEIDEDPDDVKLTFYLGADKSRIRLRHSHTERDNKYHGFFLDDTERSYKYSDATYLHIEKCEQTGISSATRANYDLKFVWKCRFIPYFDVLINNASWSYNGAPNQAKSRYEPTDENIKQCPSRNGNLTVSLELPRHLSTVGVRLLDDNEFFDSIDVDARPVIKCYPYIRDRAFGDALCVCDYDIRDADLFVKNPDPSDAEVEQLDEDEFRWVMHIPRSPNDLRRVQDRNDDLTTAYVETLEDRRLGNVVVPVYANFGEHNLAAPTTKSGVVNTIKGGVVVNTTDINPLADNLQQIFDGFSDNPADYDNNTRVELTYQSVDFFGVVAQGQAIFHGKSILYKQSTITISVFDTAKLAKLEVIAMELVERGLIDVAIELPRTGPRPDPWDPLKLLKRLRRNRQLQEIIDSKFQSAWSDKRAWRRVWDGQSELLKLAGKGSSVHIGGKTKKGQVLKATKLLNDEQQREFDAVALNVMTKLTINRVRRDRNAMDLLRSI